MNNRITVLIALSMLFALLSGCASTRSAEEMSVIQENEGFTTKELYYLGSTDSYHYFEQETFAHETYIKETKPYRIQKEELTFNDFDVMPYKLPEDKRIEVKISSTPPYTARRYDSKKPKVEKVITKRKKGFFLTEHESGFVKYPSRVGYGIGNLVGIPLAIALFPITMPIGYICDTGIWLPLSPLGLSCIGGATLLGITPYLIYECIPDGGKDSVDNKGNQ